MRGMFFRGVLVGSLTSALVLSASAALAGTGVGGIFNLGQANTVNTSSSLSGSTSGAQLAVSNSSTTTGNYGLLVNGKSLSPALVAANSTGPAARFTGASGSAPFQVGSNHKVSNLNADLLDGLDSSAFKVECPGGTTLVAGVCVETSARAADNWANAENTCASVGRRLASFSDLLAYGRAFPSAMTAEEWVDIDYWDGAFVSNTVKAGTGFSQTVGVAASESHPYRCVTGPSNQ